MSNIITNVYRYNRDNISEIFENPKQYIKDHPDCYLFSYEGEFDWDWYGIEVNGKYYNWCVGDVKGTNPATYFVEEFYYRPEMTQMSTHGSAYCPACGHVLNWEDEDGLVTCEQCHSKVEKRTFVEINWLDEWTADYHTHLVELHQLHKLDVDKIKVLNEV